MSLSHCDTYEMGEERRKETAGTVRRRTAGRRFVLHPRDVISFEQPSVRVAHACVLFCSLIKSKVSVIISLLSLLLQCTAFVCMLFLCSFLIVIFVGWLTDSNMVLTNLLVAAKSATAKTNAVRVFIIVFYKHYQTKQAQWKRPPHSHPNGRGWPINFKWN